MGRFSLARIAGAFMNPDITFFPGGCVHRNRRSHAVVEMDCEKCPIRRRCARNSAPKDKVLNRSFLQSCFGIPGPILMYPTQDHEIPSPKQHGLFDD